MSKLALQLIAENKKTKNPFLDLGNCGLKNYLPDELLDCVWLEALNLGDLYYDVSKDEWKETSNKKGNNTFVGKDLKVLKKLEKLKNLNSLALSNNQITAISFLSSLMNLNSLALNNNQITDFSFLSSLTKLNTLALSNNQITDFSFLSSLTNLNTLALSNNQITDIRFLSSLTKLNTLYLSNNQIIDCSFLSRLKKLNSLDLNKNRITDISFLSSLNKLNSLDLSYNQITDISFLSSLTNLNSLDLSYNQITDFSFLSNLRNLNSLYLSNNKVKNIRFLSNLRNLNSLYLSNNKITNIRFLSSLTNLSSLDLSYNKITDFSFLTSLTNLNTLALSINQITDIRFLSSLTKLNSLDLSNNKVTDIRFLSRLMNLNTLYLSNNQIADIRFLSSLTNLNTLYLSNNKIADILFLSSLTNLNTLYLSNNKIADVLFLSSLTKLNTLSLSNNQITDIRFLSSLTNLNSLDLSKNRVRDITPILPLIEKGIAISLKQYDLYQKINLYDNPITSPPMHIVRQGNEAIVAWFENKKVSKLKPFREAKVILLGEPDAGKSNLLNYFIGRDFETKESVTRGVKIEKYIFQHQGNDYQINFWDFGGQDVQQSVHQYFLTENTLYLIVLNAVTDEQPDKYLQFLNNHAPNSPFIIITNKDDLNGASKLKNNQINADYEGRIIASNVRISLRQAAKKEWCPANTPIFEDRNRKLKKLFALVKRIFLKLPHVEEGFLENYKAVKNVIEDVYKNQKKPYITIQEFTQYCQTNGIVVGTEKSLLSLLNIIGTVRFLDEDNLRSLHILNPEWLSDGIYRIITDGDVKNKKSGKIQKKDILQILSPQPDSVYTYQAHEIDFLVDMMCSFRVAYFDREEKSIYIPDSFPEDLPNGFNKSAFVAQSKHYFFSYETEIPSYIISRFIVKSFQYVKENHYWNKGIVLEDKEHQLNPCEALIEQNDRKIDIWIKGKDIQSFFVRIREILRNAHEKTFKKYTEMINLGEESIPYEAIWNLKIDGDQVYKSQRIIDTKTGKLKIYNINEILGRFETNETMEHKGDIYNIDNKGGNLNISGQLGGRQNKQKIITKVESSKLDEFNEIKEILLDLQKANVNNELWKNTLIKCLDEFSKLDNVEDKSTQKGIIDTSFTFLKDVKDVIDISLLPVTINESLPKLIELWNTFKANH